MQELILIPQKWTLDVTMEWITNNFCYLFSNEKFLQALVSSEKKIDANITNGSEPVGRSSDWRESVWKQAGSPRSGLSHGLTEYGPDKNASPIWRRSSKHINRSGLLTVRNGPRWNFKKLGPWWLSLKWWRTLHYYKLSAQLPSPSLLPPPPILNPSPSPSLPSPHPPATAATTTMSTGSTTTTMRRRHHHHHVDLLLGE